MKRLPRLLNSNDVFQGQPSAAPSLITTLGELVRGTQKKERERLQQTTHLKVTIMSVEFETKKQQGDVYYVNSPVPFVVESFEGLMHEHEDFALAEVLQDQESVYQSFQRNAQNEIAKAYSHADTGSNNDHGQSREEGNSLVTSSVESQLAMDEALARELQELELAGTGVGENTEKVTVLQEITLIQSSSANGEGNSASTSTQVARQDDIDPDNMTYEELQSLGEAVGTECRGLPDELISVLPYSTYKIGLFSKKEKHEECVICCMAYKNRDKLITLPCQHQYHKSCVTQWLKINKACPVCLEEVFG